jgi:hypothetical protein
LVEVIDDFNALIEHGKYCREILFKVNQTPEGIRLRVRVGRFGYDKTLSQKEAEEKVKYLRSIGAIEVKESIPDSWFFVG